MEIKLPSFSLRIVLPSPLDSSLNEEEICETLGPFRPLSAVPSKFPGFAFCVKWSSIGESGTGFYHLLFILFIHQGREQTASRNLLGL